MLYVLVLFADFLPEMHRLLLNSTTYLSPTQNMLQRKLANPNQMKCMITVFFARMSSCPMPGLIMQGFKHNLSLRVSSI